MKKKSLYKKLFVTGLASLLFFANTLAQSEVKESPVTVNGFVDFYISKNFNNPVNHSNKFRNFDITENQLSLNLAEVVIQKAASPVGFRFDLDFGPTTDLVHTLDGVVNETYKHLQQAYITAVFPLGNGLTINVGKMVTHMGAEVIETSSNINYSRSLLFSYAIPYFHTGICAIYPFSEKLTVSGYLYNGSNRIEDNNTDKTIGASVSYTPVSGLSLIQNYIGGAEQTNSTKKRHIFDSIINYQASDNLLFIGNIDYGFEDITKDDIAVWNGVALTGRYAMSENIALALRGEVYNDVDGFTTGIAQKINELTFTYEYKFYSSLLIRTEFRKDWSAKDVFDGKDGVNTKKNQTTLLIGTIYTF
ncbi:MAG: porin [Ignavibacteriaceae bacterium]